MSARARTIAACNAAAIRDLHARAYCRAVSEEALRRVCQPEENER